ncbi:MAG: bifunctional UDP-N-acetylglucosamine diphosphorylase/glucosamine-1-phosphate N-acetyltransferase GlmU [Deltaproteobacteria bacterium]|nr:bifunctional UDP-N-acetylglucosamine diphosphorylase/glucosamine-1-phosphate N-acetyltransferase GlmU [Deltaproteobacteria bacterium]
MNSLAVVILAAGLGKRMQRDCPKVLVKTISKSLIEHVVDTALSLNPERLVIVTGHKKELVEEALAKHNALPSLSYAFQAKQLGTGHALQTALPQLAGFNGTVLVLYGDVPLIRTQTLKTLVDLHEQNQAALSLIALHDNHDHDYGRVMRDAAGKIEKIVELKDCSRQDLLIREFNSGVYAMQSALLEPALASLKNNNSQGEYYLTDIIGYAYNAGLEISSLLIHDAEEVQGVNTPHDLCIVNKTLRDRKIYALIEAGVEIEDPSSLFIDEQVEVASGVKLGPQITLKGNTKILCGANLEGCAYLKDTFVAEGAVIKFGVRSENAIIGTGVSVGPFAHLRPGTKLEENSHVGNFVEVKNSNLKGGVKASHLTYLGDCVIGTGTNIGAGTITCNYDGYAKHQTVIGEGVFVGSDTCFVAPVKVGDGATIGAGSVITKDVAPHSLALSRAPQVEKKEWSKHNRKIRGG